LKILERYKLVEEVIGLLLSLSPTALLGLPFSSPKETVRRLSQTWSAADFRNRLPSRRLEELVAGNAVGVTIPDLYSVHGSLPPYEKLILASLVSMRQPRNIIEIGTFDGATALLLAANCPDATIYTLDLPEEAPEHSGPVTEVDSSLIINRKVGHVYHDTPEAARIVQLFGDSMTFDFASLGVTFDFAFIDGAHTYEYVSSDTERLHPLLGESACVIWDDYHMSAPGVRQYLNTRRANGSFRVAQSRLVVEDLNRP
jgi:predicted O-methyltransferase YrrM